MSAAALKANHCRTVVSIDFGATYTKCVLAHLKPGNEPKIKVVTGYVEGAADPMVPSLLSYSEGNDGELITYGFHAKEHIAGATDKAIYGMFKNEFPGGPKVKPLCGSGPDRSAEELFLAMAQKLLGDIKSFYSRNRQIATDQAPPWEKATIDFALSVPAAGKPALADKSLRQILSKAGFDSADNHSVLEEVLTESEAAAIHSLHTETHPEAFKSNQTTIVVDAGGGASDLCVLRVEDRDAGKVSLQFADLIAGARIGPTWADRELEQHLVDFLLESYCQLDAESTARSIVAAPVLETRKIQICSGQTSHRPLDIKINKCPHGESGKVADPTRSRIDGLSKRRLPRSDNVDVLFIENHLLERLLDEQILGMSRDGQKCIKRQLDVMIEDVWISGKGLDGTFDPLVRVGSAPDHLCVDWILLTGGFGSSRYVLEKLQAALFKERDIANEDYTGNGPVKDPYGGLGPVHMNIKNLRFIVSKEPRLCVCKGVLRHHIQKHMEQEQELQQEDRKPRFRLLNWNVAKKSAGVK
ncbi:hypothetical protein RB599_010098 [Gaeumannomyces hyphopodioides]